jgi:hypothetical protein
MTKGSLDRHVQSKRHIAAATKVMVDGHQTPSAQSFNTVIDQLKNKEYSVDGLAKSTGISNFKMRQMKWALAESLRELHRVFFRKPGLSLSLHQDSREPWFVARFVGCNDLLERRCGLFSIVDLRRHWNDNFAENLQAAATMAIANICTPLRDPPHVKRNGLAKLDTDLFNKVCSAIELINADAASDEQLAGQMMKGRLLGQRSIDLTLMGNVKSVHKDKAHASRRIAHRGFAADDYLHDCEQAAIGRGSFVQQIQHSKQLQRVFNAHAAAAGCSSEDGVDLTGVHNMGAVTVRWEASVKPLLRRTLLHDALLATAIVVMRGRHGTSEANAAVEFLQSETEERALQTAMMCDASMEVMALTRFADNELFDCTRLNEEIETVRNRLAGLFGNGLCVHSGATQIIIQKLRRHRRTIPLPGGGVKSLGGPGSVPQSLVDRCLARMMNYNTLANEIISAEFPACDILRALWIFNLKPHADHGPVNMDTDLFARSNERICNILGLDAATAKKEIIQFMPTAIAQYKEFGSNFAAWAHALTHMPRSMRCPGNGVGDAFPSLRALVKRLGAWSGSTSGCEHLFAKLVRTACVQRSELKESHLDDDGHLLCSLNEHDIDCVVLGAQRAWAAAYGDVRERALKKRRWDHGTRHKKVNDKSEKAWMVKNRKRVTHVLSNVPLKLAKLHVLPDVLWTEKHENERRFQHSKAKREQLIAYEEGRLLKDETHATIDEELKQFQQDRYRRATDLARTHRQRNLSYTSHLKGPLRMGNVFIGPKAAGDGLHGACIKLGGTLVTERKLADTFVVQDVTHVGVQTTWCSALKGATVVADPTAMWDPLFC